MLSKQAIDEFKITYKKVHSMDISDDEAEEKGSELLRFFKVIYRPIPKRDLPELKLFKESATK